VGIPIVSEIWDGIRWIINFFVDKVPTPLKFLIFLLFLLFFGTLISVMLHLTGIHCNSDKDVVKTEALDIKTNIIVWRETNNVLTEQGYKISEIHRWNKLAGVDCFYLLDDSSGEHEFCKNSTDPNCEYYYRDSDCFNCTSVDAGYIWDEGSFLPTNVGDVCDGTAYKIEWDIFDRWIVCEKLCQIPEHYVYNSSTGTYTCIDLDYCGSNATLESIPRMDDLLHDSNAELIYPITQSDRDYRSVVRIKCNNNFNPRLTFFGIDIFDYKIWLFLAVIWVLVMLFFKLNRK